MRIREFGGAKSRQYTSIEAILERSQAWACAANVVALYGSRPYSSSQEGLIAICNFESSDDVFITPKPTQLISVF